MPAIALHPYQKRWFLDRSRYKIGMFARQCGKTFTTTLEIVDDVVAQELAGRRTRWVILSRGERQAAEAINEGIKTHARAYALALDTIESEYRGQEAVYRQLEVEFPGGSKVTALPANPDTARGYSANVFLDEFAIHAKAREIWAACYPIVSRRGLKLRVTSTPKGKNNKFYELMTATDTTWSRHAVDIHQAVAEGLDRDPAELRAGLADDELWGQEYELKWLDEAAAWLPFELIFAAEHPEAGDPAGYQGGWTYVGNDIAAGGGDLWVAWVWEMVGDVLWTREIVELRRATFREQDAVLDRLMGHYRVARLAMDKTGLGEKPVEDAVRRYGAARVEGVQFTSPAKLTLATQGKAAFEARKVRIPEGSPALRADLHSLTRIVGPTGTLRFVATREGGSHADRLWAAFLGLHAAQGGVEAAGATIPPRARPAPGGRDGAARALAGGLGPLLKRLPGTLFAGRGVRVGGVP